MPVPVLKSALQTGSHTHTRNARVDGSKAGAICLNTTEREALSSNLLQSLLSY